ncbi:MAG: aminodeoxychorismate/anthranilate synthase component II [Alphaproteobacteria bacterium]|nr:aminodeoxychorismate/anthranilate synthase component II [Alphaproteobacteria bacterium]
MIVLIDNYDSFTYNLVQYFGDLGEPTEIYRNDKITVDEVLKLSPKGIVISPGPSDPNHAGICLKLIKKAAEHNIPLFGVCLGHQCIGQAFGGKIIQTHPVHGKVSNITHNNKSIFKDLSSPLSVTRYHSLIIEHETKPECLEITATTEDNIIMGVSHKEKPVHGVQFHPESIATEYGHHMLKNFIELL